MRDGTGCIKEIHCLLCAHFPFICNGLNKPSKMPKFPITQLKKEGKLAHRKGRPLGWKKVVWQDV